MSDLETVIEDSMNDLNLEDDAADVDTGTETEAAPETETAEVEAAPAGAEVTSPADKDAAPAEAKAEETLDEKPAAKSPEEEFLAKLGIPAKGIGGRENRVPHSRVQKIIAKNTADVTKRVSKEIEDKFTPQLKERDDKIVAYEGQLQQVGEFERIMTTDSRRFLGMLSKLPAYKDFFDFVEKAAKQTESPATTTTGATTTAPTDADDVMPQPDLTQPDGSKVYSMEGFNKYMDWKTRQVEKRVTQQVEERITKRYEPIEKERTEQRAQAEYIAKVTPIIEKQIAEARTWPNFAELEAEITDILNKDTKVSLEGAYMRAYQKNIVPRLTADQNTMRTRVLDELKRKPAATSAPATQGRPKAAPTNGSLEDVIRAELEAAGAIGR